MAEQLTIEQQEKNYWTPVPVKKKDHYNFQRKISEGFAFPDGKLNLSQGALFGADNGDLTEMTMYVYDYGYSYSRSRQNSLKSFGAVKQALIDKFSLQGGPFPKYRENETEKYVEFMWQGTNMRVYVFTDATEDEKAKGHGNLDASVLSYLYGIRDLDKVMNILFGKFNLCMDRGLLWYKLQDPEANSSKTFLITKEHNRVCETYGIPLRGRGYSIYGSVQTVRQLVEWLDVSPFINAESFHVMNNQYVGPADYYGCDLFKRIVDKVIEIRSNKVAIPETNTFKKIYTIWQRYNEKTFNDASEYAEQLRKARILRGKYSPNMLKEKMNLTMASAVEEAHEEFKKFIGKKEDFDFFLFSSSEETIQEQIGKFVAAHGPKLSPNTVVA